MSITTYTNIYTYVLPFYASGSTRSLPPITHKHKHNIYTHMFPSSTPPVQPGPFLRKHTNTNTNIYTHMFPSSTPPVQPGPFLRKHTNTITNIYTHMFSPSTPPVQPGPFLRKHTNTYICLLYTSPSPRDS